MESIEHLFYNCIGVREVWIGVRQWFNLTERCEWKEWLKYILVLKAATVQKDMIFTTFNAVIYTIWWTRNQLTFHNKKITTDQILKQVKDYIMQRLLFINKNSSKYYTCIDILLR